MNRSFLILAAFITVLNTSGVFAANSPKTQVEIRGARFFINGRATYQGRTW